MRLSHRKLTNLNLKSEVCALENAKIPFEIEVRKECENLKIVEITSNPPQLILTLHHNLDFLKLHGRGFNHNILSHVYHAQIELSMCRDIPNTSFNLLRALTLEVERTDTLEVISEITKKAPFLRKLAVVDKSTLSSHIATSFAVESNSLRAVVIKGLR